MQKYEVEVEDGVIAIGPSDEEGKVCNIEYYDPDVGLSLDLDREQLYELTAIFDSINLEVKMSGIFGSDNDEEDG